MDGQVMPPAVRQALSACGSEAAASAHWPPGAGLFALGLSAMQLSSGARAPVPFSVDILFLQPCHERLWCGDFGSFVSAACYTAVLWGSRNLLVSSSGHPLASWTSPAGPTLLCVRCRVLWG